MITFMDRIRNFRSAGIEMSQATHHLTKKDIFNILKSHDIETSTSEPLFHQFCHFFDGLSGNNNTQNRTATAGAKVARMELDNISDPSLAKHIKTADDNISLRNACFFSAFSKGYYFTKEHSY